MTARSPPPWPRLARGLAWSVVAILVAVPWLGSPTVRAAHWCEDTFVTVSPAFAPSGGNVTFTITLNNRGANNTNLTSVQVRFSWESGSRSLGGGAVTAGGSRQFTVVSAAIPAGLHEVNVTYAGTNDGDAPSQVTTCTTLRSFSAIPLSESVLDPLTTILLAILGFVIAFVVGLLVALFWWELRKKARPTAPTAATAEEPKPQESPDASSEPQPPEQRPPGP